MILVAGTRQLIAAARAAAAEQFIFVSLDKFPMKLTTPREFVRRMAWSGLATRAGRNRWRRRR